MVRAWAGMRGRKKRVGAQGKKISYLWIKEFGIRFKGFLKRGLRGEFREEFKKNPKEFETYFNENIEKGFASPLR